MMNDVKMTYGSGPNGPFYINEYHQVIVPVGDATKYYLAGTYDQSLRFEFEGKTISGEPIDFNGKPLRPGDKWIGPHAGIPYVLTAAIHHPTSLRNQILLGRAMAHLQSKNPSNGV